MNNMQEKELKEVIERYRSGIATEEEKALVESWYLQYQEESEQEYILEERLADAGSIWQALESGQEEAKRISLWPRIAVAASILLCLSVGGYFLLHKNKIDGPKLSINKNQIVPGSNKAVLTLANGKKISLSDAKNGQLVQLTGAIINKTTDGEIAYNNKSESNATDMVYDTLTVPRAGHFQLVFADGTKAWVNAETIIRYPEKFSGTERQVELLKGEAYFEVVHNDSKPFKVITHGQVVEDIGTHFNINAYDDEPAIKTTLLDGSVKVTEAGRNVVLKPGQQSIIKGSNSPIAVKEVDLDEAIAWKNNHFVFDNESIGNIMRQISRWYDVDVVYRGSMTGKEFAGSVSRFENVSEVLRKLEATGTIHFKIEGRKIIVTP